MKNVKILAIDIESCSVKSKYPTYNDLILGISVHSTSSLKLNSRYQHEEFVIEDLTYEAEEEMIIEFLEFLSKNQGGILTSYNLIGFDHPLLLSRCREHYPLGFQLLDLTSKLSLYDTMIAYKAYSNRLKSCKLLQAISELKEKGYDCFIVGSKAISSGKDSLSLWVKQKENISNDFSAYVGEDSYNHMRIAQVLLSLNVRDGLWVTSPLIEV